MRRASVSAPRGGTDAADRTPDAPIGWMGVGTLPAVPLPATRSTRAVRAALAGVLAVAVAAGCTTSGSDAAMGEAPTTTTTTTAPRSVPEAVAGALSTYVPAANESSPAAIELLLFGDSVAVLVADDLARELDGPLVVDAVDCRRLDLGFTGPCGGVPAGEVVARALDDLAPAVRRLADPTTAAAVLVLANNAALDRDDLDAAMAALQPVPRVWWVTTDVAGRAWRDPNNALLADLVARDPRAHLIDWFAASHGRSWLADHVHPDEDGQQALADLVAAHVRCDCTPLP